MQGIMPLSQAIDDGRGVIAIQRLVSGSIYAATTATGCSVMPPPRHVIEGRGRG